MSAYDRAVLRRRSAAVASWVAVLFALTGCTAISPATSVTPTHSDVSTATATATATATPTATVPTSTQPVVPTPAAVTGPAAAGSAAPGGIRPWASLIAKQQTIYNTWRTPWDETSCSSLSLTAASCAAQVRAGTTAASTIAHNVDAAAEQGTPANLGPVPHRIEGIWRSTRAAADVASKDGRAYQAQCSGKASKECAGLAQTFANDMDALQLDFAGWQPYV